jgi:lipoprotein signal peptidase
LTQQAACGRIEEWQTPTGKMEMMRKTLAWILRRVSGAAFSLAQNASYATYLLERKANDSRDAKASRELSDPIF